MKQPYIMLGLSQDICNEIAAQPCYHTWMNNLLKADAQTAAYMEQVMERWLENDVSPQFGSLISLVLPLLMENTAIRLYLQSHPEMRGRLQDIPTTLDAVLLGSQMAVCDSWDDRSAVEDILQAILYNQITPPSELLF